MDGGEEGVGEGWGEGVFAAGEEVEGVADVLGGWGEGGLLWGRMGFWFRVCADR